jgi:hypothetical protein
MEMSMRNALTTALIAASLALPFVGSASAETYSNDIMTRCNEAVGQMKFEGWPGDRNREMMMLACQRHGGAIPGAQNPQEQKPVSLPRRGPTRQRSAPGG